MVTVMIFYRKSKLSSSLSRIFSVPLAKGPRLRFALVFLSLAFLPLAGALQAQQPPSPCRHPLCLAAPDLLKNNYVKDLNQKFAEAQAVAAVSAMPYIGKTRVDHFTLGAQATFGVRDDVDSRFEAEGRTVSGLSDPTNTISHYSTFAGVNLGAILGFFDLLAGSLGIPLSSFTNFDILLAYSGSGTPPTSGASEYTFETSYIGLRFPLISGLSLPILGGWRGVVFGIGYLRSTIDFVEDGSVKQIKLENINWDASKQTFTWKSELNSVPIELNTGIQALFLDITAGVGVLLNTGESTLRYEREGVASNPEDPSPPGSGELNLDVESEVKVPSSVFYYKMGFEISPLPFFRIGGEASYASKGAYSYAFAARFSF